MTTKRFEDFDTRSEDHGQGDLFDSAFALDSYLRESPEKLLDGLGLTAHDPAGSEMTLSDEQDRHDVIMLGSNSYLNLTTHPRVVQAAREALDKYGYGTGAVSVFAGQTALHRQLEEAIARFYQAEDAILFASGYAMNIGVISALCDPEDVIINDAANHASIFDGSVLSRAKMKVFPHGNMKMLERVLRRLPDNSSGRLIITDGVFSMHGDLGKLDEIYELARRFGARVMVDDAHAIGVVGPTGHGTAEHYNLLGKIDLNVGTLSKAPGGLGGYCAGCKEVIRYLKLYARSYFFATSLPAPVVAGLLEVIQLMEEDKAGRERLWHNIRYMKDNLQGAGFDTGESASGVIPVLVGDDRILARFHRTLIERGVYTNIVTYPAVRRKESRVRLCVMQALTREQMDRALDIIINTGRELDIIATL